jgi:predicted GIY-YIG superfamily endonuclease
MTAPADGTALYRVRGEGAVLLYIGISKEFGRRWRDHARKQPWWGEMRSLSVDAWYESREEAEAAETAASKAEKPKYNKRHAEDPKYSKRLTHAGRQAPSRPGAPRISYDTATLGFRFSGGTYREKPFGCGATW